MCKVIIINSEKEHVCHAMNFGKDFTVADTEPQTRDAKAKQCFSFVC